MMITIMSGGGTCNTPKVKGMSDCAELGAELARNTQKHRPAYVEPLAYYS